MKDSFMQSELRGTASFEGAGGSLLRLRSEGTASGSEVGPGCSESRLLTSESLLTMTGDRSFQQIGTLAFAGRQGVLNFATQGSGLCVAHGERQDRLFVAINSISSEPGDFAARLGLMAVVMLIESDGMVFERQLLMLEADRRKN